MDQTDRLSSLARRAPMPVIGVDGDGRLTYVSDSRCARRGYDRDELRGEFLWEVLAGEDVEQWGGGFASDGEGVVANRVDARVPTATGDELLVAWHNVSLLDEEGRLEAVFSIGADVTALRQAEDRLARLNTTLEALSAISRLALRTDDPHDLLARACETLVQTGACTGAWIALVGDDRRPIGLFGSSRNNDAPAALQSSLRNLPACITQVLDGPRQVVVNEISERCDQCVFDPEDANVHGIATTIGHADEVAAVLVTHVRNSRPVGEETRRLICSVADDLGFALAMLEARAMHERTEQSLAERTRMLDAFFESSLDPAAVLDPEFNFVRVNDAYAKSCDMPPAELIGLNHFELFPHDETRRIFETVRDTGRVHDVRARPFEFPEHPEWGVTWWDWALVPTLDDRGEVALLTLWLRDVTEQEHAKRELEAQRDRLDELVRERTEELQGTNELLRAVVDGSPVAITVHDTHGNITMWNAAAEQATGWTAEEVLGGPSPLVPPEQERESESLFADIVQGETINDLALRRRHRDGHMMDLRLSAAPLRDSEGNVTSVVGIFRDVTETLRVERERERLVEQLEEERATLDAIIQNAPEGIVLTDSEARVTMVNPAAVELYRHPVPIGEDRESHVQMQLCNSDGTPRDVDDLPLSRSALHGEFIRSEEMAIVWPDGRRRDLLVSTAPIKTPDGGIAGAVGIFQDITEAKDSERERERLMRLLEEHADHLEDMVAERTRELLRSRDQVRTQRDFVTAVIENAGSIVVVVDADGTIVRFNHAAEEVSGFAADEVLGRNFIEALLPEDERERVLEDFVNDRRREAWYYESGWRRKDGGRRRISWRVSVINRPDGTMEYMIGSGWDVTDERRMARELQESEEKYRELVENARTIIIRWDLDGTIRFVNEFGLEFFGYTEEEMVGAHVGLIVPDVDSEGLDLTGLVDAIIKSPEDYWINENENIAKDGSRYWVSWSNRLVRDDEGDVVAIMAIGADRTAQRRAEEQLRASQLNLRDLTAELAMAEQRERREIATLLHDSVGQLLAFAKMKLGSMVGRSEAVDDDLGAVLHYIDEAIDETRSLTSQLSPPVLEQLGFVAALQWLADELSQRHDLPVGFVVEAEPRDMTEEVSVTLFQAVRELLINAIKHAEAEQVTVRLSLKDDAVRIEVRDDGVGFNPEVVRMRRDPGGGFGLFNVEERLTYLGGDIDLDTAPGKGASITLVCPTAPKETITP